MIAKSCQFDLLKKNFIYDDIDLVIATTQCPRNNLRNALVLRTLSGGWACSELPMLRNKMLAEA